MTQRRLVSLTGLIRVLGCRTRVIACLFNALGTTKGRDLATLSDTNQVSNNETWSSHNPHSCESRS